MTVTDKAVPPLMTVRQLARQGDVTVHVVRNYLRRGLLHHSRCSILFMNLLYDNF